MIELAFNLEQNITGKKDNADHQHFLFSNDTFKHSLSQGCQNPQLFVWFRVNTLIPNYKFKFFQTEGLCTRQFQI